MTVSEHIAEFLKKNNISNAFGIVGSHFLSLLNSLEKSNIKFYSVKHESSAGFMAAHYIRAAQKPTACLCTAGPGILNLIISIGEMYKAGLPALIISPMTSTDEFNRCGFQDDSGFGDSYSINAVLKPMTKESIILDHPENIGCCLNKIQELLFSAPYLPVHFSIPANYFETKITNSNNLQINSGLKNDDLTEIENAEKLILESKKPIILLGKRAVYPSISKDISNFVGKFNFPVITSYGAKGLIDENGPQAFGVLDLFGHRSTEWLIKNSDLVISIGYEFGCSSTLKYDNKLINGKHIMIDTIHKKYDCVYKYDVMLVGGLHSILDALKSKLDKEKYFAYSNEKMCELRTMANELDKHWNKESETTNLPLKPQRIYKLLQNVIDKNDCILVADIGASSWWAVRYLKVQAGGFQTFPYNYSMGQASGGVMGVKVASPEKNVICITGDGSFLMNGNEILTAKYYNINVVYLVFVNKMYGLVSFNQKVFSGEDTGYATKFDIPDFNKLSDAYGIPGCTVSTEEEFTTKLNEYLGIKGVPSIIAVNFDTEEMLPSKPQSINVLSDFKDMGTIAYNKFLMKAFGSVLKEKV